MKTYNIKGKIKDGYVDHIPVTMDVSADTIKELIKNNPELLDIPWTPKEGEIYWCASLNKTRHECFAFEAEWGERPFDYENLAHGNCFKTREGAEEMATQIIELLKANKNK